MSSKLSFGEFLHQSRIKEKYGLRRFARDIGWQPSNLSNLEHGRLKPPVEKTTLITIAEILGFEEESENWKLLFDLSAKENKRIIPADIKDFLSGVEGIPVLFRTIKEQKIDENGIEKIINHIKKHYSK